MRSLLTASLVTSCLMLAVAESGGKNLSGHNNTGFPQPTMAAESGGKNLSGHNNTGFPQPTMAAEPRGNNLSGDNNTGFPQPSYGGNNYTDCLDKCSKKEQDCADGSCAVASICEFVCTCVSKCDATDGMNFKSCGERLDTCFEHSPKEGYDHLKCWHKTCDSFYTAIHESRKKGETTWDGLGGWQMFGGPLPELALRGARHVPAAGLGAIAMIAAMTLAGFGVWRVVARRVRHTPLHDQGQHLQTAGTDSDNEPIIE